MKPFTHLHIYHLVIYLVIGLFSTSVLAADITPQQALDIANSFVQHDQVAQKAIRRAPAGTKIASSIAHKMPSRIAQNKDNVYIVNLGDNQGFVVVSGETGTTAEILGYCDHGSFNYDDAPIQLKDLLDYYVEAVDTLRKNPAMAASKGQNNAPRRVVSWPSYLGSIVVEPLLKTTWNQWAPYNNKCPQADGGSLGGECGGRCPSGCVPTAIAQVMKYWEWPKDTFDWANMLDNYGLSYDESNNFGRYGVTGTTTSYTAEQADAVSTLMADIGAKMGTEYHFNGSPTRFGCQVLVDHYNYEPDWEAHGGETGENVASYIKEDLDQNRPVLFRGYPKSGDGHALVCDGYTSKDYFHFNYGWGGYYNGFYLMKSLPLYTYNVSVLTNVRPYEAEQKIIDGIKYGLKHTGEADLVEYTKGVSGMPNGSVVLPDSVTDPETGITYAVTRIRQTAFYRKGYFEKLVLGNNIEAIDAFSFFSTNIDTLVLSDKMEVIPDEAFQILKIKHVTLGANTKRIGKRAFSQINIGTMQSLTIVSRSPAFEVDEEGFMQTKLVLGDWLNCITKLGKKAFYGVQFPNWRDLQLPNLEVIGDSAFSLSSSSGTPVFQIHAKVKEIAKSAFDGWSNTSVVTVNAGNPFFYGDGNNIYNKTQTSLVLSFRDLQYGYPETLVRFEPGCFRSTIGEATIPGTIVEMNGAFSECEEMSYKRCTCQCVVPPEITDETFNDKIFANNSYVNLFVPAGTEELYRQAPGWRKFNRIIGNQPYEPMAAPNMTYRMVVHSDSAQATAKVAIEEVNKIRLTEENGVPTATLLLNGRPDMQAPTEWIDSITWSPSFVFDSEEVFELNDSTYTIEAQKCNIAFDQTVFDGDVQVAIRNSVIVPRITDGVIDGGCVSISLLTDSGLVHELCGTAEIIFPVGRDAEHDICAAWFNNETGEWEPVYYEYNAENGTLLISTNHLSEFSWYRLARTNTAQVRLLTIANPVVGATARAVNDLNDALDLLQEYISSDEPDAMAARFFRNEAGFWQSVGLDCLYNGVISVTDPAFNFKPELIDEAISTVGNIGMAFTILDISRAEYEGDKVGVAANSMKFVLNHVTGALTSNFGTAALSASMSVVAFIGVALEKFGTSMQNFKMDYFRWAYRYYYSIDGYHVMGPQSKWANSGKHGYFRTPKDWYEFFEPTFLEDVMTSDQLENYIKQSVRDYCDRFWNEYPEVQNYAYNESRKHGWQSFWDSTEQLRWQISDEYYSELMNGVLVSVFRAIKNNARNNAHKRFVDEHGKMCSYVNKLVGIKFKDSSRQSGEDSQFAGMKVEFTEVPKNVTDKPFWQRKLDSKGEASLGWFTIYALLENDVYTQITLYDSLDIPVKTYDFEISYSAKDKQVITIDLAKDGTFAAEYEPVPGLYLEYDPDSIALPVTWGKEGDGYSSVINEENLYLNDSIITYRRTRFRAEIERFFNTHKTITERSNGTIMIGEDLLVVMDGNQGDATFPLKTTYRFKEQSEVEFVKIWNNPNTKFYDIEAILNGKMQHDLQCQVHVQRVLVEDHYEYQLTYTGSGACHFEVKIINYIDCEFDPNNIFDREKIDVDHIATGTCFGDADVTLHYQTTIQPEEQSEEQTEQ